MVPAVTSLVVRVNLLWFLSVLTISLLSFPAKASSGTWELVGSMNAARGGQAAVLLNDGNVLVVGGGDGYADVPGAELYDPTSKSWSVTGAPMATGSAGPGMRLGDGRVLIVDGQGIVELYDPVSRTWTTNGPIQMEGGLSKMTLLKNGKILIAGGWGADRTATLYDPATGVQSPTGSRKLDRNGGFSATLLTNGKVLIAGGSDANDVGVATAELYDPASETWSITGALHNPSGVLTTLMSNGKVLAAAGDGINGPLTSEIYDPASGTWSVSGVRSLSWANTLTPLNNGKVLAVGVGDDAEVYDPNSGTWSATPSSGGTACISQTATLLKSGAVLVAGGATACGGANPTARTMLYTPDTQNVTLTVNKTGLGSGTVTSNPAGISCGSNCSALYSNSVSVTLTATPSAGSTFTGWSGGGCSGTGTCVATMNAATTVTATFATTNPTLTVVKSGAGSGTVTSSPANINCGTTCNTAYAPNTKITLTATPDAGSTFANWSGGGCTGTGQCVVTIKANQTVTANFSANQTIILGAIPTITVGGTATLSATGGDSGNAVMFNSTTPSICTVSGSTITGKAVGTCTIAADQVGSATFNAAPRITTKVSVNPAAKTNQTIGAITFSPTTLAAKGTTTVSASASSGLAVTFSSATTSVCTVSGAKVTGVAAGTCTIAANQAGNATYTAAPQVTKSITVTGSSSATGNKLIINNNENYAQITNLWLDDVQVDGVYIASGDTWTKTVSTGSHKVKYQYRAYSGGMWWYYMSGTISFSVSSTKSYTINF